MKFSFEPDDLEILQGIVEESSEHLNGIEEGILKLEAEFNTEELDAVFRAMHSVKGVASFVDFIPIKDTAHSLESFLTDMKKGLYSSSSEITDLLLRGVDILNLLVNQLGLRLKEIEDNPPREVFEMEIDEFGFREFVAEAEEARERTVNCPDDSRSAEHLEQAENGNILPSPMDKVMKIEMSSFLGQALEDFIEETNEHLDTIEKNCVELERSPSDSEMLNAILRGFHSIKGGAGVILSMQDSDNPEDPFQNIKVLTHAAETLLQTYRNQHLPLESKVIDLILATVDRTAALSRLAKGEEGEPPAVDDLIARIEALNESDKEKVNAGGQGTVEKLPKQLSAFVNITNQALESMDSITNTAQHDTPVNMRRVKQYARALNSIAASCRYLEYTDVVEAVSSHLKYVETLSPGEDTIDPKLLENLKAGQQEIKDLLIEKINSIKGMLEQVPPEYAEKKIGEILVAEKKISPDDLENALAQQRKIGQILIDSGAVKPKDIEIALLEQQAAREKTKDAEPARTTTDVGSQSIRVSQDKMNRLMNMIGELLISKNRIFHLANTVSLQYEIPPLAREVKDVASEIARISDELQDAIMSARMVPLRVLFQRYPRTIRDISKKAGKMVDLNIEGEETELDKTVIEAINDPLVHMLRNAVDHGIESPEVRESLGKTPKGNISLKARYQGNYVVIEISDDGKGLNPDEIKAKALRKGLIRPEQIETMSNEEAYQLVFLPGFSTKEEVSELSGRGVGMDVVKNNIEQVGGAVSMSSKMNVGTNFFLKIPLSMSIIKGLMVKLRGQSYIIPLDTIEETVKLPADKIRRYKNMLLADIRGQILHIVCLKEILNFDGYDDNKETGGDSRISIVVMDVDGTRFGIIVDSFQHEQEFVVKALVEELANLKIYTGASIMGDGNVVLILNSLQLYQSFLAMNYGG